MRKKEIPQSDSIQELAAFWDAHDLTEFEDQLEVVGDTVFERQTELITVPLQPTEIEAVKRIADSKGIGYEALIREWVIEKLHVS